MGLGVGWVRQGSRISFSEKGSSLPICWMLEAVSVSRADLVRAVSDSQSLGQPAPGEVLVAVATVRDH